VQDNEENISVIKKFITKHISPFTFFNITQFLGALNDNIYKLLIIFFLIQLEGIERSPEILSLTGAIFVLPFLLFSSMSGTLADRFSKSNIIVITKILELVLMGLAVVAFAFESKWGAYTILFGLASQSALFGPSKYGILPELVPSDRIARANGLMTSFTFLAIILGTFLASFITDITNRNFIAAAIVCTFVAILGLLASFYIGYTHPAGSRKKVNPLFISEVVRTLKVTRKYTSLLPACLGSAFFLFAGAFMQLNIIPFAVSSLDMTDVQGGYLFLLIAVGIGCGSFFAGKISGKTVELALVPIGILGIAIGCFMFDYFSSSLAWIMFTSVFIGMTSGLYQVPLDSYIQVVSPNQQRGQIIATTNFLSFVGVLLASISLYVMGEVWQLTPARSFTVLGCIVTLVALYYWIEFFDYVTRFFAMILSKLHFRTDRTRAQVSSDTPAFYICQFQGWNDTLLLLGAQRRRIRFFSEQPIAHPSPFTQKLYNLLDVTYIPSLEVLMTDKNYSKMLQAILDGGVSICLLTEEWDLMGIAAQLQQAELLRGFLGENGYPIIPVLIDKGVKEKRSPFLPKTLAKFRVPASIDFVHR
jgi:acyl-[acyl-carrier-protein]-phospholipid O-acyltransferase/long-chain-fatty-acid--[acyl-carrier-protein] ligase